MTTRETLRSQLRTSLTQFEHRHGALPGISTAARRNALIEQLVDSVRRVNFVLAIQNRDISAARSSPHDQIFDPLRAALLFKEQSNFDEACWLVFLAIHFGRHRRQGWKLVRDVYAGDGPGHEWTWQAVSSNVAGFRQWLEQKNQAWQAAGIRGSFGNHRRRESLSGLAGNGTGAVVESYVQWVASAGGHSALFGAALAVTAGDSKLAFDRLYASMAAVHRFGRLGRFDFLCMIGKLGIAPIEPIGPYLKGASGPLKGAKVLTGRSTVAYLERRVAFIADQLGVNMQVIEDALCNWQKTPNAYTPFRG